MSDQSRDGSETDADGSAGDFEPGGGPRRVVSEESVDDILDSLNETDSSDASEGAGAPGSERRHESNRNERSAEPSMGGKPAAADEVDDEGEADDPTDVADGTELDGDDAGAGSTVDDAAAALPTDDDESIEELAARVEEGSVTGADVRAAEAGDGRESTPAVDEIDLTVDDLDAPEPGSDDVDRDAGPLAGSIDADAASGSETTADDGAAEDEDADDEPGLLGRLTGFFSP